MQVTRKICRSMDSMQLQLRRTHCRSSEIRIRRMTHTGRCALTSFTWGCSSDSRIIVSAMLTYCRIASGPLLLQAEERSVPAGRRGVDGERALGGEAVEV